jgi:hypothetical protein
MKRKNSVKPKVDFTHAKYISNSVRSQIEDAFEYHPWNQEKTNRGVCVKWALIKAIITIIENVPPGPDRTVAIRKIREARMDCNSAITHDGKY